jgi:GTP-binding protein
VVVINKVDKPNCTPEEVHEAVFDLMFALDANEDQLDFPVVYGSGKGGWMGPDHKNPTEDVSYLLDVIVDKVPAPKQVEGTLQMRITSLDYSSFQGRIAVGRITRGSIRPGQQVTLVKNDGTLQKGQVKELMVFEGLGKEKVKQEVGCGEIVAVMGLENFDIGDTVADSENPEGLPKFKVDEPTMSMLFTINNSPFFGREGQFVTSRHVRDRLFKEIEKNLAMRLQETDSPDRLLVFGRGILHLSILVETMRREGYEFQLGQPQVLYKEIDGQRHEPIEFLTVQVPEQFSSRVIDNVTRRKGEILNIEQKSDRTVLEFSIPARGIIGLRNVLLTATEGEAIIAHRFKGYEPFKGQIATPRPGCIVSAETGTSIAYAIDKLQDRGKFFIEPGEEVYAGQVIGESPKPGEELGVNVIRVKKLTNMRASGSDDKVSIAPPVKFSLEECMEYIAEDEYLEVTPKSLRIRKILLDENERKRAAKKLQEA